MFYLGIAGKCGKLSLGSVLVILLFASAALLAHASRPAFHEVAPSLYQVKMLPELRVRMRDGVELAVLIIRPDAEGKFPAVVSYYPYRAVSLLKSAFGKSNSAATDSAVVHLDAVNYLVERGYVSVIYDVRGTGDSGGASKDMYSDAERQDGFDMVEWIATQDWSNGNVGMWGISYGGVDTWQVAAMAPPHLKAIIVADGTDDVYSDFTYPGGMPRPNVFGNFWTDFAPPDRDITDERWHRIWRDRLQESVPWPIGFLKHQTDDAYWRTRSLRPNYKRIKCSVFVIAGWAGWYPTAALRAFAELNVPKRVLIGPWGHSWPEDGLPGPRVDGRPEYLRWFDQFLKGLNTGVLEEPPVTIFVNQFQAPAPMYKDERGFWRQEKEWPLTRTLYTPMYLEAQGRLEWETDGNKEPERDSYSYRPSASEMSGVLAEPWFMPLDQRPDELYALAYTSAPLTADMEITGTPAADLFVSSSANNAYFVVRICDVSPDNTSKLIVDGAINASHRNSRNYPEWLQPGQVYHLKFELKSVAYVFPAGHRIRVDISSADFQNAWPISKPAVNTIVRGRLFPSRVTLPVAPPQFPLLPEPDLTPSLSVLPDTIKKPKSPPTLTRDLVNQTTTLSSGDGVDRMTYTVSDLNPWSASISQDNEYVVPGQESEIKLRQHIAILSDEDTFRCVAELKVMIDGNDYFSKSWTVSVPRTLN